MAGLAGEGMGSERNYCYKLTGLTADKCQVPANLHFKDLKLKKTCRCQKSKIKKRKNAENTQQFRPRLWEEKQT